MEEENKNVTNPIPQNELVLIPEIPEETNKENLFDTSISDPNQKPVKPPKKSKAGLFLFIILLVGAIYYFYILYLPDQAMDKCVKDLTKYIEKYYTSNKNEINFLEDDINQVIEVTFNTTNKDLIKLNDLKINIAASESTKNEFAKANITLKQGNSYQEISTLIKEKNIVYNIAGIKNGLLSAETKENMFDNIKQYSSNSFTKEDIKYIIEKYLEYIKESFKETNINQTDSIMEVNYVVVLDKKTKEKINNKFNELVKNDEKLSKLYSSDYKLIKDINDDTIKVDLTLNRFNRKINKLIYQKNDKTTSLVRISTDTLKLTSDDDESKTIIKEKTDAREFTVYDKDDKEVQNGSISWTDYNIKLNYNDLDNNSNYSLTYQKQSDLKSDLIASYSKDKYNLTFNLYLESKENQMINTGIIKINSNDNEYTINLNQTINFGNNLVTIEELKPARNIKTLTDQELTNLQNDLENKLDSFEFTKLLDEFQDKIA